METITLTFGDCPYFWQLQNSSDTTYIKLFYVAVFDYYLIQFLFLFDNNKEVIVFDRL